jgi:hypothetical protein
MFKLENTRWFHGAVVLTVGVLLAGAGQAAMADDVVDLSLAAAPLQEQTETTVSTSESSWDVSDCPASFDITYYVLSDYIFRGINFSEWPGEGTEALNHQVTSGLGLDLAQLFGREPGTWGTFRIDTFFEWYADQEKLNPEQGGQNLQEIDYTFSWSYPLDSISTDLSIGWTYYYFPNLEYLLEQDGEEATNNDNATNEWWFRLEHNDAWLWKWLWPDNEGGILNPSFFFVQDVGIGAGNALWIELGISHEFALVENLTLTPSLTVGIEHDYYRRFAGDPDENAFRFANMLYGLDLTYDMTELLSIPDGYGSVALSSFLYFSNARGTAEHHGTIEDEVFGGMSIGYSFGG